MAVAWFWTAIITLLSTFCIKPFLLIKTVPRGTREPTSWSRKTLLDTEPLLLYQQWTVASSMGEGRTPVLLRRGVSEKSDRGYHRAKQLTRFIVVTSKSSV